MSSKLLPADSAAKKKPAGSTETAGAVVVKKRKPASGSAVSVPRGPEPPDEPRPVGQRQCEAHETAVELDAAESLRARIEIYNRRGKRVVFLAASLWPRLMPMLNGEFEFIALTSADVE